MYTWLPTSFGFILVIEARHLEAKDANGIMHYCIQ